MSLEVTHWYIQILSLLLNLPAKILCCCYLIGCFLHFIFAWELGVFGVGSINLGAAFDVPGIDGTWNPAPKGCHALGELMATPPHRSGHLGPYCLGVLGCDSPGPHVPAYQLTFCKGFCKGPFLINYLLTLRQVLSEEVWLSKRTG